MENISARPSGSIEEIMNTYGTMLFRLCLITLGNVSDAEDAVQETMIKYLQKTPKFENAEHEKAWLITVATNICLTGMTTLAATGKLQGFFKDITRWDGAITGTLYEQATAEINLSVAAVSDKLTIMAKMINPEVVPYSTFDTFGIERYEIVDMNGKTIFEGKTELVEIVEGEAIIVIPIDDFVSGNYKLIVSEFVGSSKADQPLIISGNWECEFFC